MKNKSSDKSRKGSKSISSWDDAEFDPAGFVSDLKDFASHLESGKKLTLRRFTVTSATPQFTPEEIVALRESSHLSRPVFAQILNVPPITVRKWESGERKPSGAALRLLEVMKAQPETLLRLCGA